MRLHQISESPESPESPESMIDLFLEGEENKAIGLLATELRQQTARTTEMWKTWENEFNTIRNSLLDPESRQAHSMGSWFVSATTNAIWWIAYGLEAVSKQQFLGHRYDRVDDKSMHSQLSGWIRHTIKSIRNMKQWRKKWDSTDYHLAKANLPFQLRKHPLINDGVDKIWEEVIKIANYAHYIIKLFEYYVLNIRKRVPKQL